ncbi:MAG: hypothetical protein Q9195_007526 [Heterodermia aff. obscurata]
MDIPRQLTGMGQVVCSHLAQIGILQYGIHWYFQHFVSFVPCLFRRQNRKNRGVRASLRGHTDTINAIKFARIGPNGPVVILSGSSDKTVRLWHSSVTSVCEFSYTVVLEGHTSSINCLAFNQDRNLVISGSADGTLIIWSLSFTQDEFHISLIQTIPTTPKLLPLTLALSKLGAAGNLVLAVAGTKGHVQVYICGAEESQFHLQATLVGHENWVRSLAIVSENDTPNSDLLLASASQDKYIRLWRIRQDKQATPDGTVTKRNFMSSLSNKAHLLRTFGASYLLTFEALLLGHEDWIYTVQWCTAGPKLQLLSSSADNSLAVWEAEESSGIWVCKTRLGEISSQKGSTTATGSTGGFWNGLWSPDGQSVVSLGRTGSWRLWIYDRESDHWRQRFGVSGHVGPITGIAWAKDGAFILSTGGDQTTRLHAAWKHGEDETWHEFSRPQIHGYDLNCIDSIGSTHFISGADEKSLRVFDEPKGTADLLQRLCGISLPSDHAMPDAANIPVLGLSNKAIENLKDNQPSNGDVEPTDAPDPSLGADYKHPNPENPPLEDQLARHTLWPEREKLYGHGYEISAVATSHDGAIIATACRASSIDHAVIRLYETKEWREVKPALTSHSLTVTCLRFSEDDKYLLSVGRDRKWSLFERDASDPEKFSLACSNAKGHTRMILSASWAPGDARVFATAGRDKVVKIWRVLENGQGLEPKCLTTMTYPVAVTAVDFAPRMVRDGLVIAVGTEDGEVSVSILSLPDMGLRSSQKIDDA